MSRDYEVDFRAPQRTAAESPSAADDVRACSIVAGEISTGKTTVLDFIDYCLGASSHPSHQEVLRQVRSAQLELDLGGIPHVIERAVGQPSTSANVWNMTLNELRATPGAVAERRPIRPVGDPTSLSSLLLSHCGLEGVLLREAPTNPESQTDPLSFRDLMWLSYMRNERMDDKNLLFEGGHMKALKLRQVVDVVFGVHDYRAVELGQRVDELVKIVAKARGELTATQSFVAEQQPAEKMELALRLQAAQEELAATTALLRELDQRARSATDFAANVRQRHAEAAGHARRTSAIVRDRETLLRRMVPLRAQYAEDVRKLTLLAEAHQLFDPLRVSVCPACLTKLASAPDVQDGHCSLCHSELPSGTSFIALGSINPDGHPTEMTKDSAHAEPENGEAQGVDDGDGTAPLEVAAELRSTQARLKELSDYVEALDEGLTQLRLQLVRTETLEREAARGLDEATSVAINPYLAERDGLTRRRQAVTGQIDEVEAGLRLIAGLERRETLVNLHERNLAAAREQLASLSTTTDRQGVVAAISQRFGAILSDFKYPKLERPFVADDLVPHVREARYTEASSGARTLISLAWILSIFEIAWERGAGHPGFLMIDSPQKNLGAHAGDAADEFADAGIVQGIYGHIETWLLGLGAGAQLVLVDNAPPDRVNDKIVVRFSRDPQHGPYGLIADEVG